MEMQRTYSNPDPHGVEGESPSPRGDNSERVKIHLKIFSRTSRPKSFKLGTN
jgi:hypothetical protein